MRPRSQELARQGPEAHEGDHVAMPGVRVADPALPPATTTARLPLRRSTTCTSLDSLSLTLLRSSVILDQRYGHLGQTPLELRAKQVALPDGGVSMILTSKNSAYSGLHSMALTVVSGPPSLSTACENRWAAYRLERADRCVAKPVARGPALRLGREHVHERRLDPRSPSSARCGSNSGGPQHRLRLR